MLGAQYIKKWTRWKTASKLLLGLVMGLSLSQVSLEPLEFFFYDHMVRLSASRTRPSGLVETIAINEQTLRDHQGHPHARDHVQVIENLLDHDPLAIVYLFDPGLVAGDTASRKELGDLLGNDDRVHFALNDLPPPERVDLLLLTPPFDLVRVEPAPLTIDKVIFGKDSVTRRMITKQVGGGPTLHAHLASKTLGKGLLTPPGRFDYAGTEQVFINYSQPGTYKPTGFHELLSQTKGNLPDWKDKIILIGMDTHESTAQYSATPFLYDPESMTRLEIHANMFDTLLTQSETHRMGWWTRLLVTMTMAILTVFTVLTLGPLAGILILLGSVFLYMLGAWASFRWLNLWWPITHPLMAAFVCYYFLIPYRLIVENRRSWEYYQKNRLLTQVEELKSNFLRMMSHDLRTPLARIQGMAHMVLADANPLSGTQRKALQSISESSEELSDFIGSILSLGRIESKEMKLHLKTQDINSLISEVVAKCSDLAARKDIQILTELEPLFSFKLDPDLIRQVLTNLIENAIKYSPNGSRILVTSEEQSGRAVIQVADQGMGITKEDQPYIFDKFFRTSKARSADLAGSGLGLYLVKYFVELHKGYVDVESEPGKGSTFSIALPMNVEPPATKKPDTHANQGVAHA